jgi:hypothetical protein
LHDRAQVRDIGGDLTAQFLAALQQGASPFRVPLFYS